MTANQSFASLPRLEVRFANGSAYVYGSRARLSPAEHALLFAIARYRRASPRETLVDLFWPHADAAQAQNSFKVVLHRLRRRLGGNDSIRCDSFGYSLHRDAVVDLLDLEAAAERVRFDTVPSQEELGALQRVFEQWCAPAPIVFDRYEWLEDVHSKARALAAEVGAKLGQGWLRTGRFRHALEIANRLIEVDVCDEHATELALLANLQLADRSSALRVYRRYEDALRRQLGLRPSPHVKALLFEPAVMAAQAARFAR